MSAHQTPDHVAEDVTDAQNMVLSGEPEAAETSLVSPSEKADESGPIAKPEAPDVKSDLEQLQKELDLEPRRIILAKVKGYRAWPAMVLDETYLPENIRALKPKSIKLAKKSKKPVIVIPVRFFSDDTYIWMKSCDVTPLNDEAIETYLTKKVNAKRDTLTDAYMLAQNPPDMVEFIAWGSNGRPPTPDLRAESADMDSDDEPQRKKLKLSFKIKKAANKKASKPTPVSKLIKNESDGGDEEDFDGFDSDWGLEDGEYDYQNGDYIFEDESEQNSFFSNFPTALELAETLSIFQEQFAELHHLISPQLMSEEAGDERKVLTELRKVEELVGSADTPIIAFRKSPLYRVLLLTVHKPVEVSKSESVRMHIGKIFQKLAMQPCVITMEDLREKSEPEASGESESESRESMDFKGEGNQEEHETGQEERSEIIYPDEAEKIHPDETEKIHPDEAEKIHQDEAEKIHQDEAEKIHQEASRTSAIPNGTEH